MENYLQSPFKIWRRASWKDEFIRRTEWEGEKAGEVSRSDWLIDIQMLGNILVYDRVVTRTFTRNLNIDIRDCNIGQKIFLIKYLKYQNIINNNIIEWSSQDLRYIKSSSRLEVRCYLVHQSVVEAQWIIKRYWTISGYTNSSLMGGGNLEESNFDFTNECWAKPYPRR